MTTRDATSPCCRRSKTWLIDESDCSAISALTLSSAAKVSASAMSWRVPTERTAIVLLRDVTGLRRLEQQRDECLALISHGLRSPQSGIMIFVDGMKRSMGQNGLSVNLAERAERNATPMKAMLAEATIVESQGVTLRRVACDLGELVGSGGLLNWQRTAA